MLKPTPADRLHQQTLAAIGDRTSYQVGHMWAGKTGDPKKAMARVREWRSRQPKTLGDYAELMDSIGFEVVVRPKRQQSATPRSPESA